jgi:DMSO/TMAO reductase YedYZ heme-binding membrane subunit
MLKIKVYFYTAAFAAVLAAIHATKAVISGLEYDPINGPLCSAFTVIAIMLYMMCLETKHQLKLGTSPSGE